MTYTQPKDHMKKILFLLVCIASFNIYSVERPDLALDIQHQFVCKSGKSLSGNKYKSACRKLSKTADSMLFMYIDMKDALLFHNQLVSEEGLGSVYSWCKRELVDPTSGLPTTIGVDCVIHATDKKNPIHKGQLAINYIRPNSNLIGINISYLDSNVEYYLELVVYF